MNRREVQRQAVDTFNRKNSLNATEQEVKVGSATHRFDLFQKGEVAGGVTTGTWKTSNGNNNTGAQDHAIAELLWLDLVKTVKRKVLILTDQEMVRGLLNRFQNAGFRKPIEIWHFDLRAHKISPRGSLK